MNYKENRKSFLLWGWMLTFASFSHFIILRILHSREAFELVGLFSFGIWIGSGIVAFTIQLIKWYEPQSKLWTQRTVQAPRNYTYFSRPPKLYAKAD